jgi:hypothetical protein
MLNLFEVWKGKIEENDIFWLPKPRVAGSIPVARSKNPKVC